MTKGSIVIVGSGTIGTSLACICSIYGWTTWLVGRRAESLETARKYAEGSYKELVDAELLPESGDSWSERLVYTTDLSQACKGADYVIEAINEDIEAKQGLFRQLERLVSDKTILASSTSGLPVDNIAALCADKARIATAHFANPPHLMPVVEIVPGTSTTGRTMDKLAALVESLDKDSIRLNNDLPGHLFNRIQFAMLREAIALARDNIASVEDIDNVVKKGLALRLAVEGPLQKIDLASLDLVSSVAEYLFPELDASSRPDYLNELLSKGYRGSINGRGFYEWTEEQTADVISKRNQEVIRHLQRIRRDKQIT